MYFEDAGYTLWSMNGQEHALSEPLPYPREPTPLTLEAEYLTHDQFLAFVGWNQRKYIRQHAKGEVPPAIRLGKQRLYRRRAVLDWLATQERPHPKAATRPRSRKCA